MINSTDWLPLAYAALMAFSLLAYVLMDGWDIGIGILYPLVARRRDRDQMLASIGPLWDANETWLVFGGMLLLLGFPKAYAALLSQIYVPVFAMLFALVLRGVSYEFRYQGETSGELWGYIFSAGSLIAAFSQGYILGRVVEGAVDPGSLSPVFAAVRVGFPWICGVGLIGGYALLGACWLILKTDGALQTTAREVSQSALLLTLLLLVGVSSFTPLVSEHVAHRWFDTDLRFLSPVALLLYGTIAWRLWRSVWAGNDRRPLQWAIALFILSFAGVAVSLFPYIVPYEYTLFAAANDHTSLAFAAVGIAIVLPVVILYLTLGYRVFRGKLTPVPQPDSPTISSRRTSGHQADLHLS